MYIGTPAFNNQTSVTPAALAPWERITSLPGAAAAYAADSRILEYPMHLLDFWVDKTDWDQLQKIATQIYLPHYAAGWDAYYRNSTVAGALPALRKPTGTFQFLRLPIG